MDNLVQLDGPTGQETAKVPGARTKRRAPQPQEPKTRPVPGGGIGA